MKKENILNKIEEINKLTLELRGDIFYGKVKNKGNAILDRFNEITWELDRLKTIINEL